MGIPKLGFSSDRQRVVREYGRAHEITVDGQTFRVKSGAEERFFRELEICIAAGMVKEWWYEPERFPLDYKYGGDYRDSYMPDALVVWRDPAQGAIYYEVKAGALDPKYASKIKRFCLAHPDKKLALVWIGSLPRMDSQSKKQAALARRIDKLMPLLDHIWVIRVKK